MFNFDYMKPGTSRHGYFNNDPHSFYDYPPRNSNNQGPASTDRVRDGHRGARRGFNSNFTNQNSGMSYYPNTQWTSSQQYPNNYKKPISLNQKDKRAESNYNRDKERANRSQQSRKNKNNVNDKRTTNSLCKEIDFRLYKCPNCLLQFDFFSRYNSYSGRVPLILNCKHTLCQDCIFKLRKDSSILCPICNNPSVIPSKCCLDDLQDIFSPNFFLIGFVMWCKTQGTNPNFMALVPVQTPPLTKTSLPTPQHAEETCCFLACNNVATLHCQDCSDVYCHECCTIVHKSAKSLWSHKQVHLSENKKNTLELEHCPEHNMVLEFYCVSCDTYACCYCLVDKHESHVKENLVKLSQEELQEFQTNKQNAKNLLKHLLISQKRLKDLYNCSTANIEKNISSYFVNYHAKLQFVEKKLKKELSNYSSEGKAIADVEELNTKLVTSIDTLTNIVACCDSVGNKKLNLKKLSQRLKAVQDTPCYLISDCNKRLEPLEFEVDPYADDIEDFFTIVRSGSSHFKLVTEDDLPSDYEIELVDQQCDSDVESCNSSLSKNSELKSKICSDEKPKRRYTTKQSHQVSLENEKVEVTHIESLECFYVQLKKSQNQFSQMNRDITDYIKMGAPLVEHPQLNELYLVMYQTKNEKIWCRGRITELKNGETEPLFEVFLIDYGSTQTIDVSRLRQITSSLAQKKPFAIHCELYNPSMTTWGKNAHVYMAKMINGKQVTMLVKKVLSGVHEVDLMIMSSDRGQTSIIDILIHTCNNALNNSSDSESVCSSIQKSSFNTGYKIYGNSAEFQKFQEEKVILVNVLDPHHIFVHLVTHAESFKKMNNALRAKYKNSRKNTCLPIEGTYVIVDFKDSVRGQWHRGLVKTVDFSTEKCFVLLVDWGLNVTVSLANIRTISEEFTRLESQAILVKLTHVEPIDKGPWLECATTFLLKYYRTKEVMRIIVQNTDPLEVALFEILGDVDICVNASLVQENYAESTGKVSEILEWARNEVEMRGFSDEDGLVATLLKQVEAIEEEYENEEDKNLVKQKIEVVKFDSPDLIYIKFSLYENQEACLNNELHIHYSKERKTKSSWKKDEMCVVLYNISYARGKILEEVGDKKYRVNVYDRAAEVVLPLDKIFEFEKYFSKFPNVVFKSHLANIRPAGGDKWSLSSVEALERMFDKYKNIYGTKVQGDTTGKSIPMHMWYTKVKMGGALEASQTKFISLNNLLVKLGFAYKLATSKPGSDKNDQSLRLKSPDSKNPSISPFITAIESVSDSTDSTDFIPDLNEENPAKMQYSIAELKSYALSDSSYQSSDSSKLNISKDWNSLIEEEERTNKNSEANDSPYRRREAKINDWIPAFPISKREFKALITCAETGGILYLREESLQNVYKEMEQNIKEYFDNAPTIEDKHHWEVGQLCTIRYNDYYYRGKVYKLNGPDDLTAVMIDFGSDHSVTKKDLKREILYPKIPAFASKIKLDKVYPKSGAWLDSDYETFLEIVSEFAKIVIKGPLNVDVPLAEVYTNKGVNVNERLVELCPNLTRSPSTPESVSDYDDEGAVIVEEAIIENEKDLVETKTFDQDEVVEAACLPVDTTKFKYEILSLPNKNPDEKINVTIMFVLEYNKVALKETLNITDEFFQLGDQIQVAVKSLPVLTNLEVGMPCVCPFSEDGMWYRAQVYNIDGINECGYVFVFFVDFGNVESVAVTDIKMMLPEWFKFPVSCYIAQLNIEINSDKNIHHVTQHMKKLCGKNKRAEVISKEPLYVALYDSNCELSYQSLLDKGLVKLK